MFVEIHPALLRKIATDSERIPSLYYSDHALVRQFFWMRLKLLYALISKSVNSQATCLDFGGGGGVFLPTLARYFQRVVFIDLEDKEARSVVEQFDLKNVRLIKSDIAKGDLEDASFDIVIAADILEHFQDLSFPVSVIKRWLKNDGRLYTSLPTENWIYTSLRKVFGVQKPEDHYHTGYEVERYLQSNGFKPVRKKFVPLVINLFPLFLVTEWRRL